MSHIKFLYCNVIEWLSREKKNIHPQSKVRTLLCEQSVKCLAILTQKWEEIDILFENLRNGYTKPH